MRFRSYRTALRVDSIHVACRLLTRALCLSRVWNMEPLNFYWEPQSSVYHVCCGMPWACALAEKNVNMTVIIILVLIIFFVKVAFYHQIIGAQVQKTVFTGIQWLCLE